MGLKKYGNNEGMKAQEDYILLQKSRACSSKQEKEDLW